jgi:hypothetical protein
VAILVDDAVWPWRGRQWAHLVSDESYDELHAFAAGIGIPRRAFQGDHYDIPAELRLVAIEQGALPVDGRSLVRRLRAAGLRRPRRPGAPAPVGAPAIPSAVLRSPDADRR